MADRPYEKTFSETLPKRFSLWDAAKHLRQALMDWDRDGTAEPMVMVTSNLGYLDWIKFLNSTKKYLKKGVSLGVRQIEILHSSKDFRIRTKIIIVGFQSTEIPSLIFHLGSNSEDAEEVEGLSEYLLASLGEYRKIQEVLAAARADDALDPDFWLWDTTSERGDTARPILQSANTSSWRRFLQLITVQPLAVQLVGGTLATLLAAALMAAIAKLFGS
ncbi:hypothetical protein [Microbispora hainanensis]|uniref:hypothetical protein n=1 Tax=Microbispora hainanensis TaxID=568844 RepID=UPI00340CB4AF